MHHGATSGAVGLVTVVLGAAFILASSYLTLKDAILPGTGPADRPQSVETLQRISPSELNDAAAAAGAAFARDPLDTTAILDLSHIAAVRDDVDAAERLTLIAGQMRPRATAVQAEALTIMLKRRDFDAVMSRLDGLIRAKPSAADGVFALVAEIAGDDDGSRAVARMLAGNPAWRRQFFQSTISKGQAETAFKVMNALRSMGAPVDVSELRAVIDDHLKRGEIDRAYAVWLSSLSDEELKAVRRIYDGDFKEPVRSLHFDWTIKPGDGFTHRLFPRNTASMDMTMQLDFLNFSGPFANLSQILRLRPGRYRLSGEARFENFASSTGMVFRLYCLEAGAVRALDETGALPQSNQWIDFEKTFVVPRGGCDNQLLQLESRTTAETGQTTHGMVAIDAINIDSLPDLAP